MSTRDDFDSVEDALYHVARFSDVSTATIASRMGVSADWLRDATDPRRKPRFPATKIVALTVASENYAVVRTINRDVGVATFQVPRHHPSEMFVALGEALRQFGEVPDTIGAAVATHGRVTATNAAAIIHKIDAAIERLATLRGTFTSLVEEAQPGSRGRL